MYEKASTRVKNLWEGTKNFSIRAELHQSTALSPWIFSLIIVETKKNIWIEVLWCMLFGDNIVVVVDRPKKVKGRLEV